MFPAVPRCSSWRALAVLAVLGGGAACTGGTASGPASGAASGATSAGPAPITVFAASSLTESLPAVAAAWTAQGGGTVTFAFDASSRLAKQIEAGARADVFVSADTAWVDWLADRVPVAARADLLGNTLVVVVRADAPVALARPADLAGPAVTHLAVAGENVPAGAYARAALGATGVGDAVAGRVVSGDNVRTALAWVATGEAEAAVVYRTDARVEPRVTAAFAFDADTHPPIVYTGAALGPDGAAFLAFCRSAEAQAIFAAAGFAPPPGAAIQAGSTPAGSIPAGSTPAGSAGPR